LKLRDDKKTQQIFQAALGLVKENGLAGITMCEIAKEAKIATGTLYIYFKNKEELINILFTECRKAQLENYLRNYDISKPFKSGFTTVWKNILKFRVENFEEVVFMDQCYHSPFINECTIKLTKQMKQPLIKLIERGKDENVFKEVETYSLLTFMIGSIHEGVKNAHYSQKPLTKTAIDAMFTMCWDGMKR
jgi:AcrR family transcriptional regulator